MDDKQIDKLIKELEDFILAVIHCHEDSSVESSMTLIHYRESLKECIKETQVVDRIADKMASEILEDEDFRERMKSKWPP
jgi:hypothetical protein